MAGSARRHLEAADALVPTRFDIAGYLYGLAAECAIKAMLVELGARPLSLDQRRQDPFYQHFPGLLTSSKNKVSGRRGATLASILETPSFMAGWSIEMRYSASGEIPRFSVQRWALQAKMAVGAIGS